MRLAFLALLLTTLLLPTAATAQNHAGTPGSATQAQSDPRALLRSAATHTDVRNRIRGLVTRDGLSLVNTSEQGLSLYVSTRDGHVVDYVGLDEHGRQLPLMAAPVDERVYWECARAADGDAHCWQVDRPAAEGD